MNPPNHLLMTMRNALVLCLIVTLAARVLGDEDQMFVDMSEPFDRAPRPERQINELPTGISYMEIGPQLHQYAVEGIYVREEEKDQAYPFSYYKTLVPDCVDVSLDWDERRCTLTMTQEMTYSDLAYAIDDLARWGGHFPYWLELEARDTPKSKSFREDLYQVADFKGEFPTNLAWFLVPRYEQLVLTLNMDTWRQSTVVFVPTTAHCMAGSRFAMRILDGKGNLLWHDDSTAFAGVKAALADLDEDGVHEILLYRSDHGQEAKLLIRHNFEQPPSGDVPTATPEE